MKFKVLLLSSLIALSVGTTAQAQTNLLSTQFRPVEEAQKMQDILLRGANAQFIAENGNTFLTRMQAELGAAQGKVHVTLALDGEHSPVNALGGYLDVDDLIKKLSVDREFNAGALQIGKMGGSTAKFVPFVMNTFQMAANKEALKYLPAGANLNTLTWTQLIAWAKAVKAGTGENKFGIPAGPQGLIHRFFQGYAYPAYTGGLVRTFKSADAEKMWADLKDLWTVTHPRSTSYGFMEEPLKTGEVWIAFDHTARLLPALNDKPDNFVVFPAPAGPKGRFYMPVITGLAIPKNTPDRAASERLIDHMTRPATQAAALREVGFFPTVKADVGALPRGVQIAAGGVAATFGGAGARGALLPAGLGAKNGEFNKVFIDSFQRIVVKNEDIKAVLADQGRTLEALMKEANVPCWSPDASSGATACPVN